MTGDPTRSPFAGLAIESRAEPVVELLVVGLILEAAIRGEELGTDPVTLLMSDSDARRETAISGLVDHLACELAISSVEVEARASQYFLDYRSTAPQGAGSAWRPPRVWPFAGFDS
jgi:hypothetical protein